MERSSGGPVLARHAAASPAAGCGISPVAGGGRGEEMALGDGGGALEAGHVGDVQARLPQPDLGRRTRTNGAWVGFTVEPEAEESVTGLGFRVRNPLKGQHGSR